MQYFDIPKENTYSTFSELVSNMQPFDYPKVETLYYAFDFIPGSDNVDQFEQKVVNVAFYENKIELIKLQ